MDPNKSDISGFGRLFQDILSEGGDVEKRIEEKLHDKTMRVAFTEFAKEHRDLVSESPLLSRVSIYAEELNQTDVPENNPVLLGSTPEPLAHRVKKVGNKRFNEGIVTLENALFNPANTSASIGDLHLTDIKHLMSLYQANLISERQLSAILSAKGKYEMTFLHDRSHFNFLLPFLLELAETKPKFVLQLISAKDHYGEMPIDDSSVLKVALPLLNKLADKDLDSLIEILTTQNRFGEMPIHTDEIFMAALPFLERLAETNLDRVIEIVTTQDKTGVIPIYNPSSFDAALPLLERLAVKNAAYFVDLLSKPNTDGKMLISHQLNVKTFLPLLLKLAETNLDRVIEILMSQDKYGYTPLYDPSIFRDALPFLEKLAETNLDRIIAIFRVQNDTPYVLIQYPDIFSQSLEILKTLAERDPNSLIQILTTPNYRGNRAIDTPDIMKLAFPLFNQLFEKDPDRVIRILSTPSEKGEMPLIWAEAFIAFLPLLEKLAENRPDSLIQLIPMEHGDHIGPLFFLDSFKAALPLLEKLADSSPEHVFALLTNPNNPQHKPLFHSRVLKAAKPFLISLARSNQPLLIRLLSDRSSQGTTPLDYLDYTTEVVPLISRLGLKNSPSIKDIVRLGSLSKEDLKLLMGFFDRLEVDFKLSEEALGELRIFAKTNRDLLIQILAYRNRFGKALLEDRENFKLALPLLNEWADNAPDLFIEALSIGEPFSDLYTVGLFTPLLQRLFDKESFDLIGEILKPDVVKKIDQEFKSSLLRGVNLEELEEIRQLFMLYLNLLRCPLKEEVLRSIAFCVVNLGILDQDDPAFHLAVSYTEIDPRSTDSPVEIHKKLVAWQKVSPSKKLKADKADSFEKADHTLKRKEGFSAGEGDVKHSSKRVKVSPDDEEERVSEEVSPFKREIDATTVEEDAVPSAKRVKSSPVEVQPPLTFTGVAGASLSLEGLQKGAEESVITRDMIPPAATLENWHRARESLRARIEELPTPRDDYSDFDILWDKCLNDPFFEECLNFREGQEIKPHKAQWAAILNWILSLDNTVPAGAANALSPQQEALYLAAYSYVHCDTGKEINIDVQYHALPPGFKLSIKVLETSENALQMRARYAFMSFIRECVTQMIGSNRVLEDLTGIVGREQGVHDIKYIKNAIGWIVGLGNTISFDPYPLVAPKLIQMDRDELFERFLKHLTPRALINAFIRASENEPQFKRPGEVSFGDHARALIPNSAAFWEIDPDTDLPFRLNERGALEILRILGVVDVAEPPLLLRCPSAFAAKIGTLSAGELQPFVWVENKDISYQLGNFRSSTIQLVRGKGEKLLSWIRHSDALEAKIKEAWIGKDQELRKDILANWGEISPELKLALLSSSFYWEDELKEVLHRQWNACDPKSKREILDAWQLPQGSSLADLIGIWNKATDVQKDLAMQFIDGTSAALKQALMGQWEKCSPSMKGEIIKLIPEAYISKFQSGWNRLVSEVSRDYAGPVSTLIENVLQDYPHPLSLVTLLEGREQIADLLVPAANVQLRTKVKQAIADTVFARIQEFFKGDLHPAFLEAASLLVEGSPADKGKELKAVLDAPDFQQRRWEAFKSATAQFKEYLQHEGFHIDPFMQYCHDANQLLPSTSLESFKDYQSVQQEFESLIQIAMERSNKEHVFDLKEAKAKYDLLAARLGQAPMEIAMDE